MPHDNTFTTKLASIIPAGTNKIASDVRLRISESFAEIEVARERGVSWQQIADLMVADGLRTLDGNKPTQSVVRTLYHKERYNLGGKRKKRRGSKPAPAAMQHVAVLSCPTLPVKPPEPATVPKGGTARWMANADDQIKRRCR